MKSKEDLATYAREYYHKNKHRMKRSKNKRTGDPEYLAKRRAIYKSLPYEVKLKLYQENEARRRKRLARNPVARAKRAAWDALRKGRIKDHLLPLQLQFIISQLEKYNGPN